MILFLKIREFLVDTPNAPTSTKIIVLPAGRNKLLQKPSKVDNEIPNFKISSGVQNERFGWKSTWYRGLGRCLMIKLTEFTQ